MFADQYCKKSERKKDSNKYEKMWERRIKRCELIDHKFRERKWKSVGILIGFRKWEKEAWGGVSGKDMLTKFAKCKSKRRVKEKG